MLLDLLDPVCLYGSLFVRSFVCSFVRSFVCSFVRVPERSIWSSEFRFYTNEMLRNFEFESHQAQSVIYPFRSMRSVCHSARNAIDVLNLNYSVDTPSLDAIPFR